MSTVRYPMLYWPLREGLVAGVLPGEGLKLIRSDVRKLKSAMAAEMKREDNWLDEPITSPKLRTVPVSLNPAWTKDGKTYPMSREVVVQVDALYGRNDGGSYTCYLPRLSRTFFFYEIDQIELMVTHFARDTLRALSPEALYRHLLAPPAALEIIPLHSKPRQPRRNKKKPDPERLSRIAEKLPAQRRPGQLQAAWQRSEVVHELAAMFTDQPHTNVLLVGGSGVGKSTVLREAVKRVARSKTELTFWRTTARRLISGARYLGDWQRMCEDLIDELEEHRGILWIEALDELLRIGGSGPEDSVAAFLTPAIAAGKIRLVGELTERSLDACRAALPDFTERFTVRRLPELPISEMAPLLGKFNEHSTRNLDQTFTPAALRLSARLLDRHVRYERFPGKAIRFLTDAAHHARLSGISELDEDLILDRFIQRTGMPRPLIDDAIPLDAAEMRTWFSDRIIGQPDAVEEAARVVEVFKTGLNDPERPIATLLFVGPTGVGKTALARALTGYFFGESDVEKALIRVDMSELQLPGQLSRIIGSPDGTPGELIRRLRARPFSVVLFDEIEKADPVFFDTLLTVLDEGLLADSLGRETDFRSAVVIMTSNLGAGGSGGVGFSRSSARNDLGAVKAFFRPEFFNRIDRVVQFSALGPDDIQRIARLELAGLQKREGVVGRDLTLRFTDALVAHLARVGFHPEYGARALQRQIERQVVSALSYALLADPGRRGGTLTLDHDGERVVVR